MRGALRTLPRAPANEAGPGYEIIKRPSGEILSLKGKWRDEVSEVAVARGLKHLRISVYAGWQGDEIGFLLRLGQIETLDIVAPTVRDFSPLYSLSRLRKLSLNGKTGSIDFTQLPALEDVSLGSWSAKHMSSVFRCGNLKNLAIAGYSGPDLREFDPLTQKLEGLSLGRLKIENLFGLPAFPRLIRLFITLAARLKSLEGVERSLGLQVLCVEQARELTRIDAVAQLRKLRTLIFSNCPQIESIRCIEGLPELATVGLMEKTNVIDGDIAVLKTLPALIHARFVDRPHYSNRRAEFPAEKGRLAPPFFY